MNIHPYSEKLFLVELQPALAGFGRFIGAWVYKGSHTVVVDVGPTATVPDLLQALQTLKVKHLDYILLTHIHLDHAGGIGDFSARFPETPIVVHKNGLVHLENPARLWEGSLGTLGDTARAYGRVAAVPKHRLVAADRFVGKAITPVETLGHSPHHVSYITPDCLFAGEAGGVCIQLPGKRTWMRPATPPQFFLNRALSSLDALIALSPETICYGHFGMQSDSGHWLTRQREQLVLWEELIGLEICNGPQENFTARCLERLLVKDPELVFFHELSKPAQGRETYFLTNSIKGFLSWIVTDKGRAG